MGKVEGWTEEGCIAGQAVKATLQDAPSLPSEYGEEQPPVLAVRQGIRQFVVVWECAKARLLLPIGGHDAARCVVGPY
jgi:hypothetical protein